MKTKFFIISLISCFFLLSCGQKPTKDDCQEYIDSLKPYYPYSIDEKFVFFNEALGLTWEAKAFDEPKGVYPYTHMSYIDEIVAKSYGRWNVSIVAYMHEKDMPPYSDEMSFVRTHISGDAKSAHMDWNVKIRFNEEEIFEVDGTFIGDKKEIFSFMTDTIIIPVPEGVDTYSYLKVPEGSYARIVKNQGLTDFSVDGKTVWKRVK